MTFVTFRGLTLYREKLLLELSRKIANIITRHVNALKWYLIKYLLFFPTFLNGWKGLELSLLLKITSGFSRISRVLRAFLKPILPRMLFFMDVKALWYQNVCDVSVIHLLALWSVFGQNARAPSRSQSFLFVIQSDKRLPQIRPGSNRKYFWRNSGRRRISSLFTRETSRDSRGRGFDPRGPSNTQGPKITEKWGYCLGSVGPASG